ncbi:hypothetical protein SERLA73DRAFT_179420 [Serpula lacrymans var. lacrymans S7.3]|uniref:Uncharacterized protein n=2 Tax=Serpula lacrymans var. lacrymans TaxID=341189 RepID=F8PSE4_SERL3|nr:uncharacterized protein SERLADRAFT_464530 [Serpula lacrymans var. lacrymans S7.9]EGO01274.1 hypothetical protein SERLA73DRAFT_179420 [Serpula lacrymans var. lacrymans S7.3]EGO26914.1 hypothetical protein SERLADRAFT_464530 [Serpula lacrymans var. lacrymans S7.9]
MSSLEPQRSLDNIAREIAEAEDAHAVNIDGNAEGNTLVETLIRLNNLQDNLEQVGYYGKELWDEVLAVWNVLAKAVNERAKMDGEGQSEEGEGDEE